MSIVDGVILDKDLIQLNWHFKGDSGGPLFVIDSAKQFLQIGVQLQSSDPCGGSIDEPDVYANVGSFENWIQSVISK